MRWSAPHSWPVLTVLEKGHSAVHQIAAGGIGIHSGQLLGIPDNRVLRRAVCVGDGNGLRQR